MRQQLHRLHPPPPDPAQGPRAVAERRHRIPRRQRLHRAGAVGRVDQRARDIGRQRLGPGRAQKHRLASRLPRTRAGKPRHLTADAHQEQPRTPPDRLDRDRATHRVPSAQRGIFGQHQPLRPLVQADPDRLCILYQHRQRLGQPRGPALRPRRFRQDHPVQRIDADGDALRTHACPEPPVFLPSRPRSCLASVYRSLPAKNPRPRKPLYPRAYSRYSRPMTAGIRHTSASRRRRRA